MAVIAVLPGLDPARYERHGLHAADRIWVEKNCYIDIWIEVLHALGLEPMAVLPFVVAVDFEGDQWTFFKPPHEELRQLYGVDVQEMYPWRSLLEHAQEHLAHGRMISTEADAWWLPDTSGTDYRSAHTKTTIVLNSIDVEAKRLGYFHNSAYHQLDGEDFDRTFRVGQPYDPAFMPLYAELVRTRERFVLPPLELRAQSRRLLQQHVRRIASQNPVAAFSARFAQDLSWFQQAGLATYHVWAFGTLRQLGAATELAALYLDWLEATPAGGAPAGSAAQRGRDAYLEISNLCKSLILKLARAVNSGRPFDVAAAFSPMVAAWDQATEAVRALA